MVRRIAVVVIAGTTACALFTDLSGFTGGALASEAGASEAGPGGPGSAATALGDAGTAASMCNGRDAAFCTDFDHGTLADLPADRNVTPGGEDVRIETVASVSPPRSLLATMPAYPDRGLHYAQLCTRIAMPTRQVVSVDLALLAAKRSWAGGNVAVLEVQYGQLAERVFLADDLLTITTEKPDLVFDSSSKPMPPDTWTRLRLDADFAPGSGHVRLFLDTRLVAERASIPFPTSNATSTVVCIGLARYNAPTPELDVRYDDVVVELH